jgi:3-methyl-2-oxobutanoate hydroxymethyltransferase
MRLPRIPSLSVGRVFATSPLATGAIRTYSVHPASFDELQTPAPTRPKVTLANLRKMYMTNQKIAVMTAYDFPSGTFADRAGTDIVLVGDSLGMVALGLESTNQVTLQVLSLHVPR